MSDSEHAPTHAQNSTGQSRFEISEESPGVTDTETDTTTENTGVRPPSWLSLESDEQVLWHGRPRWRSLLTNMWVLVAVVSGVVAIGIQLSGGIPTTVTLGLPSLEYTLLTWSIKVPAASTTVPIGWLPVGVGSIAVILCVSAARYPLFSRYALTDHAIYLKTGIRSADQTRVTLDRLCGVWSRFRVLGSVLSYGDLIVELTGTSATELTLRGITPDIVSQLIHDLDVDPATSIDLRPEHISVSPARDAPDPHEIIEELESLHSVFRPQSRFRDYVGGSRNRPSITLDIYSRGDSHPVEFYFGAHRHLDALEQRLRKALPNTFDIQRIKCDLSALLIPPRVYTPAEFKQALKAGTVQCSPRKVAALHARYDQSQSEAAHLQADGGTDFRRTSENPSSSSTSKITSPSLDVDSTANSTVLALPQLDTETDLDNDTVHTEDATPLSTSARDDLQEIETPVKTPTGDVLARPAAEETTPVGIEWHEDGDRMMPLKPFDEVVTAHDGRAPAAHPLSTIIDGLATTVHPSVFHAKIEAEDDWTQAAETRQEQIRRGTDSRFSVPIRIIKFVVMNVLEILFLVIEDIFSSLLGGNGENDSRKSHKQRSQYDRLDDSSRSRNEHEEYPNDDDPKIDLIAQKQPHRTYLVNLSWMSVLPTEDDSYTDPATRAPRLNKRLDTLTSVFNRVSTAEYGVSGSRVRSGYRKKTKTKRARQAFSCVLDRKSLTSSTRSRLRNRGHTNTNIRVNSGGLANFASVPGANSLTTTGIQGTRAEQDSRKSLSPPHSDQLERLHTTRGLDIGHVVDDEGTPFEEIASLSPEVLTSHYARLVSTDGGKTIALTNDALSLYENTDGPVVLVDTRGGNLVTNYMRSHAARFGFEDLEENVLHFSIPDIMPGFSFFDIRPSVENGRSRIDAIADKTDNYQEILELAMGSEYSDANVAPILIPSLLKTLYDEEYGFENGRYRESLDYFAHDQFEHVIDQLRKAGPPDPEPSAAPQSSARNVTRVIQRQLERDKRSFEMVMGGVNTRTHYISGDDRLQPMFNNTDSRFEFRDMLDENKVILLDLSGLRKASARVVSGVLLTELFDALRENQETVAAKPSEYLVNVLVDEAASVIGSATVNTMLEEGRKFRLSLGLATQFPEQFQYEADRQAYLNVLNNVATPIVGQINVDEKIAETLAYDELSVEAVQNRLKYLPRGELMVRTRSKGWGENHPTPFTLTPMPIPAGHPDGDAPLSDAEEQRFQEVLSRVDERTYREFGVHADHTPPAYLTPGELQAYLGGESSAFDDVLIEVVRTVQLHEEVAEANEWVALEAVEDELTRLFNAVEGLDAETDGPTAEELDAIEQRSNLLELDVEEGVDIIRLTEMGIENAALDLGHVKAAGGADHVGLLEAIEQELSAIGFSVTLVKQDGRELPDARAFHPDVDETYHIEAEHTTPEVPIKVFDNLWKAQNTGCTPIFVVETDPDMPTYWARRVEHILSPPVKHAYEDGRIEYYTYDEEVELAGGTTAVRPTNGPNDSRYSVWTGTAGGQYVLRDSNRTEYARITTWEDLTKQDFPGVTWYDSDSNQHVVFAEGEEHRYNSKEALAKDWVTVKKPYIPEMELFEPEYTRDDYEIVMLPLAADERPESDDSQSTEFPGEPMVYRNETTYPLAVLVEGIPDERAVATSSDHLGYQDDSKVNNTDGGPDESSNEASANGESNMNDHSANPLERFFQECVTKDADDVAEPMWIDDDGVPFVPKDIFKETIETWLDTQTDQQNSSITKTALAQDILPEYIGEFSSPRKSIAGDRVQCYGGFALTEHGNVLYFDT